MIFPFYWMVITSLKTEGEISLMVPTFFPKVLALSNIPNAIIRLNAWRLLYEKETVSSPLYTSHGCFNHGWLCVKGRFKRDNYRR